MALNDKEKFAKYQTALLILAKSCARLKAIESRLNHSVISVDEAKIRLKGEIDKMEKVFNAIVKIEEKV